MHAKQLAELGAWLVASADWLGKAWQDPCERQAADYWAASRCRFQRWNQSLRLLADDLQRPEQSHRPWAAIQAVAGEILMSELLTRTWASILVEKEMPQNAEPWRCMAHSILVGHLEASNRVLRMILDKETQIPEARQLNQLRRLMERWTDLVLGWMPNPNTAASFGFDPARVRAFAADHGRDPARIRQRHRIQLASFCESMQKHAAVGPANPDLNRQIALSVLACVPVGRFDYDLLPPSTWLLKLEQTQEHAQALVDQWLTLV